jgi:transcriptional regulator with XRE-family HTH domain
MEKALPALYIEVISILIIQGAIVLPIPLIRDRLGMTQEQFAEALSLSRYTVMRYESGKHQKLQLSLAQVRKLVELMEQAGLPIKELPEDIE